MAQFHELRQYVNRLYSDVGKAQLIFRGLQKGYAIGPEYRDQARRIFENAGKIQEAVSLANEPIQVIQIYERAECFVEAARYAEQQSLHAQRNALYERAIEKCIKKNDFETAAKIYRRLGHTEEAKLCLEKVIESYSSRGLLDKAAQLAEKMGLRQKAEEILNRKRGNQTTELYDVIQTTARGDIISEEGINSYLQAGRIEDAAKIALQQGLVDKAIEIYENAEQYATAAEIAENRAREIEKNNKKLLLRTIVDAVSTIPKISSENSVARRLKPNILLPFFNREFLGTQKEKEQYILRAIADYEKAGWIDSAVRVSQEHNLQERAILVYEKAGQFHEAVALARKYGKLERALMIYEQIGRFDLAAELSKEYKEQTGRIHFIRRAKWKRQTAAYMAIEDRLNPQKRKEEQKGQEQPRHIVRQNVVRQPLTDIIYHVGVSMFADFISNTIIAYATAKKHPVKTIAALITLLTPLGLSNVYSSEHASYNRTCSVPPQTAVLPHPSPAITGMPSVPPLRKEQPKQRTKYKAKHDVQKHDAEVDYSARQGSRTARYAATPTQQNGAVVYVGAAVQFMPSTYYVGDKVSTQVNIDARTGEQYVPISGFDIQLIASPANTMADTSDDRVLNGTGHFTRVHQTPRTVQGIEYGYGTLVDLVDINGRPLEPGTWNVYVQGTVNGIPLRKDKISYDIITIQGEAPEKREETQYGARIAVEKDIYHEGDNFRYHVDVFAVKARQQVAVSNYEISVLISPAQTPSDFTDDVILRTLSKTYPTPAVLTELEYDITRQLPHLTAGDYIAFTFGSVDGNPVTGISYDTFRVENSEKELPVHPQ